MSAFGGKADILFAVQMSVFDLKRNMGPRPLATILGIFDHGDRVPLPFLLTDDTIYQRAPAVALAYVGSAAPVKAFASAAGHRLIFAA